jgi:hypothetical protein
MEDGNLPDLTDTIHMLLSDYVQAYRVGAAHTVNKKDIEQANKRRDLKIFELAYDYPVNKSESKRPNPLLDSEMKTFKRTDDMREAVSLLPELVRKALIKANGNPEVLARELSKIKRNSYQTVPSPERSPIKFGQYAGWMNRTDKDAGARIYDYMRRNAINKQKSEMVPSL